MRALAFILALMFLALPAAASAPSMTDYIKLDEINSYVNEHCTYTDQGDANPWGRCGDKGWKGNCKDFALEKKRELILAGFDPKRLVVWDVIVISDGPEGEGTGPTGGHAVLLVDGEWTLDNRYMLVHPRSYMEARGYMFICPIKQEYDGPTITGDDSDRCLPYIKRKP